MTTLEDTAKVLGRMVDAIVLRTGPHATLEELDESALVRILKEPKNALTRQYQKLFEMEGVHLRFTDGALGAIAREVVGWGETRQVLTPANLLKSRQLVEAFDEHAEICDRDEASRERQPA